MRVNWIVVTGNRLSNNQWPSWTIIKHSYLLLKSIGICVEGLIILISCLKIYHYLFSNFICNRNTVNFRLYLKAFCIYISINFGKVELCISFITIKCDDYHLCSFSIMCSFYCTVFFCRIGCRSEYVSSWFLSTSLICFIIVIVNIEWLSCCS